MKSTVEIFNEEKESMERMQVITAEFQADSCLAMRRINGESDLILSADSDFSVMAFDSTNKTPV